MKKIPLLLFFTVVTVFVLSAQEVAEDEFLNAEPIEFINYEGPYDVINTLEQIRGIGEILGQDVEPDVSLSAAYGPYRIVHSYQPEIQEGLDGDILIMGSSSQVDSVTNLRHIIGGYLESAYGYTRERAFTLAVFITYYNALRYQEIDHFSSRYKEGVIDNLEPDKCGMARIWSDWPGKARIVIPLRAPGYTESTSIDTALISSEEVVEVMQEEEDKRIEERKEMVEIREEENRQVEEAVEEKEQELAERESALIEQVEELEEKDDPLTVEELETLVELKEEQEALEEEKEELEEVKEELEEKTDEVLDMRDEIASDENEIISEGDPEVEKKESVFVSPEEEGAVPLFFFNQTGTEDGYAFGTIALYDLTSGIKEKESTVTTIYGRSHREFAGGFLAIGKDRNSGKVLPMIIDRENLAISLKGEEEIFPGTQVEIDKSNQLYMVYLDDGGTWRLGRFDKDLKLTGASSEKVEPMTDILFYNGRLFVQSTGGSVLELNSDTLTVEKELE